MNLCSVMAVMTIPHGTVMLLTNALRVGVAFPEIVVGTIEIVFPFYGRRLITQMGSLPLFTDFFRGIVLRKMAIGTLYLLFSMNLPGKVHFFLAGQIHIAVFDLPGGPDSAEFFGAAK